MVDELDFAGIKRLADIELAKFKTRLALEVLDIGQTTRNEIIDGDDGVALGEQRVAKVRAEEAGASGDENPHARGAFTADFCGAASGRPTLT